MLDKESTMSNDRTQDARDHDDSAIIDDAERAPAEQLSSGGNIARDVGKQDEQRRATDPDAGVTRVEKADAEQRPVSGRSDHQGAQQ